MSSNYEVSAVLSYFYVRDNILKIILNFTFPYIFSYTKEEKLRNATINTFLHQLALTKFKSLQNCDFEHRFMMIQNGQSAFGKSRMLYLVKTDVKNAFGSVNKGIIILYIT